MRIQVSTNTKYDRYPAIFSEVSVRLGHRARVLSFGCSTGSEVLTLAQKYFDQSEIIGVDVNPEAINAAQAAAAGADLRSNKVSFELDEGAEDWAKSKYDCIFAMSVLCLWPQTEGKDNITMIFPFAHFKKMIGKLDRALRPGGYLVIYNSNYLFEDTKTAQWYDKVTNVTVFPPAKVTLFDVDGKPSSRASVVIFQKRKKIVPSRKPSFLRRVKAALRRRLWTG